jgi:hypothetical protein
MEYKGKQVSIKLSILYLTNWYWSFYTIKGMIHFSGTTLASAAQCANLQSAPSHSFQRTTKSFVLRAMKRSLQLDAASARRWSTREVSHTRMNLGTGNALYVPTVIHHWPDSVSHPKTRNHIVPIAMASCLRNDAVLVWSQSQVILSFDSIVNEHYLILTYGLFASHEKSKFKKFPRLNLDLNNC